MSRAFTSKMNDFIDEQGSIRDSLAKRKKKLAEHLGFIIAYATSSPETKNKKIVSCWNKINKKSCSGSIDAGIDVEYFEILWHCLKCGDHGSIKHWEHTAWDGGNR